MPRPRSLARAAWGHHTQLCFNTAGGMLCLYACTDEQVCAFAPAGAAHAQYVRPLPVRLEAAANARAGRRCPAHSWRCSGPPCRTSRGAPRRRRRARRPSLSRNPCSAAAPQLHVHALPLFLFPTTLTLISYTPISCPACAPKTAAAAVMLLRKTPSNGCPQHKCTLHVACTPRALTARWSRGSAQGRYCTSAGYQSDSRILQDLNGRTMHMFSQTNTASST